MSVNVFLGNHKNEQVFWIPKKEKNPHLLVVGTSGSGKTESLKAIIHELKVQGVPSLVIDFHNEYRDVSESKINLRDLTINPLELIVGKRPQYVVYEVANILRKIFRLGDRQEALLRSAIKDCYTSKGINILKEATSEMISPNFMEIREHIHHRTTNTNKAIAESLLNRIEALLEVDIFFEENTVIPFDKIVERTTTIELKDFPTEDVKAAIAEFFINKLIYHIYKMGKSPNLRLYCVVDEAHRLLYENSPLDRMLREARKYGTGVILSSQRPIDFSETILANTGGLLSLQCNLERDAKFIAKQMDVDFKDILTLNEAGLAYLKLTSSADTLPVKILPISERKVISESNELISKPIKIDDVVKAIDVVKPIPKKSMELYKAPDVKEHIREIKNLRHQMDRRELELRAYKAQIKDLKEENKVLSKEVDRLIKERMHSKPAKKVEVAGKLCRGCSFLNKKSAFYCTECGNRL